jgi:hypothetical protein
MAAKGQGKATIEYDVAADELVIEKRTDSVKLWPDGLYVNWGVAEACKQKAEHTSRSMTDTRLEHAGQVLFITIMRHCMPHYLSYLIFGYLVGEAFECLRASKGKLDRRPVEEGLQGDGATAEEEVAVTNPARMIQFSMYLTLQTDMTVW